MLETLRLIPKFGYHKDLCALHAQFSDPERFYVQQRLCELYIRNLERERVWKRFTNAAKYAPRQQKKYERMAFQMAALMFPGQYDAMRQYREYVRGIQSQYRQVTEELMSARQWDRIDPNLVPSLCLQQRKKQLLNTQGAADTVREKCAREFKEHVERALGGDKSAKVHSRRLMAYELVREHEKLMFSNDPSLSRMLEAQWIDILREAEQHAGLLQQSAVMVDVSGSMTC